MSYTMEKFIEAFRNENPSQFINSLTGEEIKNFLIEVNRQVRELKPEEGGIYKGELMRVGNCISPKGEIQEKYFDKMAEFLKCVNSKKDMAIGMFYLINYLHLFQDGNGRTSRFVYEAMTNSNFQDYNGKFFRHKNGEETSRAGFCHLKGIAEIVDAKNYSGYAIYQYLTSMDLLPEELKKMNLYCSRAHIPNSDYGSAYISEKAIDEGILASEVRLFNRAIKDNNESFSVGALTLLMMMKKKGKSITDYNTDCKLIRDFETSTATRLFINVYDEDDDGPHFCEVLADWSREDYLRAIRIADKIKEMLLDVNMDIIQYPNDFMCESGETFLDFFKSPTRAETVDAVDKLIYSTVRMNPESRTFKHIETLKKILEEECVKLASENIGVIELGKQTYSEQQDARAKQNETVQRNEMMQIEFAQTNEIIQSEEYYP